MRDAYTMLAKTPWAAASEMGDCLGESDEIDDAKGPPNRAKRPLGEKTSKSQSRVKGGYIADIDTLPGKSRNDFGNRKH